MKLPLILTAALTAGCAVPTTGIVPRSEGMYIHYATLSSVLSEMHLRICPDGTQ